MNLRAFCIMMRDEIADAQPNSELVKMFDQYCELEKMRRDFRMRWRFFLSRKDDPSRAGHEIIKRGLTKKDKREFARDPDKFIKKVVDGE